MSTGTGVWRETVARAARLRARAHGVSKREWESAIAVAPKAALTALVRQIFFSSAHCTRVLFIAADDGTPISALCEQIGRVLAQLSRGTVGVSARNSEATGDHATCPIEVSSAIELGGNLWRVPIEVFEAESPSVVPTAERFNYLVLGTTLADEAAPLLCKACDGAVLVIRANQTRREAALRAKEILLGWNVELLGAVLDNRTFPVPESLYRRL